MPLLKSSSKKAMKKNIETEMDAGKPQKQSIAIAYDMAKRGKPIKKMSEGGTLGEAIGFPKKMSQGGMAIEKENYDNDDTSDMSMADKIMKKHKKMAKGGILDQDAEGSSDLDESHDDGAVDIMLNGAPVKQSFNERNHDMMDENYDEPLEHLSYPAQSSIHASEGNQEDEDQKSSDDIVSKIMRKMRS